MGMTKKLVLSVIAAVFYSFASYAKPDLTHQEDGKGFFSYLHGHNYR